MSESNAPAAPELVIPVQEALDLQGVLAIRARVRGATGTVVLDFREARAVTAAVLGLLFDEVRRDCGARVVARGLGRDQLRILRYLGVDAAA
jgi:anti-anti-sigma regulatory factor